MLRTKLLGAALVLAGSGLAVTTALSSPSGRPAAPPQRGLPNLAMVLPSDVAVAPLYTSTGEPVAGRWAVRFTSVVENRGRGPLIVEGHREAVGQPCLPVDDPANRCELGDMTGDQVVVRADGTTRTRKGVAVIAFDPVHYHWHMRDAERYELRTPAGARVLRDAKTGFCFGDRFTTRRPAPSHHPGLQDGLANCEYGHSDPAHDGRRALALTEGISAGWRDDYPSFENGRPLEGQQLEVTGLAAGRYVLVNRVNPNAAFRETTLEDNASSRLLRLSWPDGPAARPRIKKLRACPGKASCRPR